MTKEQLIEQINQLTVAEKIELFEAISKGVRKELRRKDSRASAETIEIEQRLAAVDRLQGILKTEDAPPTDEELREDYTNYLAEKYS